MRAGWVAFGLVALLVSGSAAAQERRFGLTQAEASAEARRFDWRRERSRILIHSALSNITQHCVGNYGFTAQPEQTHQAMQRRIEAHLLLADDGLATVARWTAWTNALGRETEANVDRAADAILAARADPSRYAEAEALYIRIFRVDLQPKLEACRAAQGDPFVGQHYLAGEGQLTSEAELRTWFADAIRRVGESN